MQPKTHAVFYDTNDLIYCDLIVPQFVGHSKVRCLRTFILPTTFCNEVVQPTAFCNEVFENLYYVPVEKRAIRDITILIIDTLGNPFAFPNSKTPAKYVFHFRRVPQLLYIITSPTSSAFIPNCGTIGTEISTSSGARTW